MRTFGKDIYEGKITLEEAHEENSLNSIRNFKNNTKLQNEKKKQEKEIVLKNLYDFLRQDKYFLMVLIVKYF